ncbi:hypothetical protein WA026_017329 [Henosepilachna vigintioctopunctata]|uniref:Uncharacterized protein n=1 Tax=Henosepilachna vigintioctopunctata TaxID=420089 RepID=A0AAW1UH47_9CUCU
MFANKNIKFLTTLAEYKRSFTGRIVLSSLVKRKFKKYRQTRQNSYNSIFSEVSKVIYSFPTMKSTATSILSVLLLTCILHITSSQEAKEVGMEPISEKTNTLLDFYAKLDNALLKANTAVSPKLYLLSPEEQKYLEYRRLLELRGNAENYEMLLPFLVAKQANLQGKTKKNAEVNRGMYSLMNHMDLFNAGKRGYHL